MGCCLHLARHTFVGSCLFRNEVRATPDVVAVAYVHTTGGKVLEFEDVRPDSIGPSAVHPGVIGIEFNSGAVEVAHVPFVEFWHIEYR